MALLLAARAIDAKEAYRLGLINQVAAVSQLEAATEECQDILRSSPMILAATKALAGRGLEAGGLRSAINSQPAQPEYEAWLTSSA